MSDRILGREHVCAARWACPVTFAGRGATIPATIPAATAAAPTATVCFAHKKSILRDKAAAPGTYLGAEDHTKPSIVAEWYSHPPPPPPYPPSLPGFGVWHLKHERLDAKTLAPQLGQGQSPSRGGGPP